jgi:hypothetical protein
LSNLSKLTTHQNCSGDSDLSSFACVLKTPSLVISVVRVRDAGRFVMSDESSSLRTVSPESANRSANLRNVVDQRPPGNHTCGCAVTSMSMAELETRPLVASEGVTEAG